MVIIPCVAFIALVIVLASIFGGSTTASKSELAKVMELTGEQEADIMSLFESCGIGELSSVELFQSGEERTSYYIDDTETAAYYGADSTIIVWVDNATKAVQEIYFHDATIYANGEVQGQVSDYYISEEACNSYRTSAQLLINQLLNYPNTAKYPNRSGWHFEVRDGYDVIQSNVTSQNAFGVSNTIKFTLKYDRDSGEIVSLVMDGKEYIK